MIEKTKTYKARMFFCILALFFSSEKCRQKVGQADADISAYSVVINWDLIKSEDGSSFNLKDTFTIIQKNDIYMYVISRPYENSYITYNKNDSIIDEKVQTGVSYNYYVFYKKEKSGTKYDSLDAKKGTNFQTDSLVHSKNYFKSGINLDSNYKLASKKSATKFNEIETYCIIKKLDENDPDSVYLSFSSKLNKVPYSFSNEIDREHQMKLFKIQIIYNPLKKGKFSFPLPRRELLFEIINTSVPDPKDINSLFNRFENNGTAKDSPSN